MIPNSTGSWHGVRRSMRWGFAICVGTFPLLLALETPPEIVRVYIFFGCTLGFFCLPIAYSWLTHIARWTLLWWRQKRNPATFTLVMLVLLIAWVHWLPETPAWIAQLCLSIMLFGFSVARHRIKRLPSKITFGLLTITVCSAIAWVCYFGSTVAPIGVDSIAALLQTDSEESTQFVVANTDIRLLRLLSALALCGIALMVWQLFAAKETLPNRLGEKPASEMSPVSTQLLLIGSAGLLAMAATDLANFASQMSTSANLALRAHTESTQAYATGRQQISPPKDVTLAAVPPDIVIYIGESTTRHHMGIYGYLRETTPFLSSFSAEIIRFDDAIAPHSHTARALGEMLTDLNFEGGKGLRPTAKRTADNALQPIGLIDILNAGGFMTSWFSNHNQFGIWDNPVTSLAERAHSSHFFRRNFGGYTNAVQYDDFMVSKAVEALRQNSPSNRVSFIHSYAGHIDYCKNIPPQWRDSFKATWSSAAYFGDRRLDPKGDLARVDCYDSAIRYIDDNLRQVIETARDLAKPTVVVYVSDHGDDADNGSSHNSELHTYQHTDVPQLIYFNPAAKKAFPAQFSALNENRAKPFETADLYHLIGDLAQIDSYHVDRTRSPASDLFRIRPRHILPRGMTWLSPDSTTPTDRLDMRDAMEIAQERLRAVDAKIRDKLCIHHVGTLGKLKEAKLLLKCVEFDAVFNGVTGDFSLFHPPDADMGLDISTYLSAAGSLKLWMDLKNLDVTNFERIFKRLNELDAQYSLRNRLILEIGADFIDAPHQVHAFKVASSGWRTSLYLPTDKGTHCRDPSVNETKFCVDLETSIQRVFKEFGFAYVSYDVSLWPWVRDSARLAHLPSITWDFSEIIQRSNFKFTSSPQFKKNDVFLIPLRSEYAYGQFDCCAHPAYQQP